MSLEAWIVLGLLIIVGGIFELLAVELRQIVHRETPITRVTRAVILRWPGLAVTIGGVVLFVVGLLFAHFFWDAGLL